MAHIFGKIDSLKELRNRLDKYGIKNISTIREMKSFLNSFESKKKEILDEVKNKLHLEIKALKDYLNDNEIRLKNKKDFQAKKIDTETENIISKIDLLNNKSGSFFARIIIGGINRYKLNLRLRYLKKNKTRIVNKSVYKFESIIKSKRLKLSEYSKYEKKVINSRYRLKILELNHTYEALQELYPLIAGAEGEHKVVKEISKLSDDYYLINDYSLKFNPPIYNRREDDRIFSIQIDHLLISNSGIYIIETKNWSKKTIESKDMRSPVDQVKRTSFALFVLINGSVKRGGLSLKHHFGEKKISIRNLIVMIYNKPKGDFKYVKILTLKELNNYLSYFEPKYTNEEVKRIVNFLRNKQLKTL